MTAVTVALIFFYFDYCLGYWNVIVTLQSEMKLGVWMGGWMDDMTDGSISHNIVL